jgi:hypothetical protein
MHLGGRLVLGKATLHELNSEDEYEAELAQCVGVTGYHRWFFLKAISESIGVRMRMFAVEKGGERIGVLPILLRRRGPISTANYLPVPRVGPLLRDAETYPDVLAAAEPFLLRQLTAATKWAFAPGSPATPEPLSALGFDVHPIDNFVVPASRSTTEHLAAMSRTLRKELRDCQAAGMKAAQADVHEIKEWFADRVAAPYSKQGLIPAYSRQSALRLVELLGTDPRMLWRSVYDDRGQLVAVIASIIDPDRLYAWIMVGDHSNPPSPHVFMLWDAIEWALNHGLDCDLSGAPNDGIRKYKLRLGAVPEPCINAERVRPAAYQKLRSLHARISLRAAQTESH